MTGVAVNVTFVPEQIEFPKFETILTVGDMSGVAVMTMLLLVTVNVEGQLALLVITQLITSDVASVLSE